jgi:release factor glutamine methyltransferase
VTQSSPTPGPAEAARVRVWTVRELLSWSRDWLARKGVESPRLDAELLLARALGVERIRLYVEHDKPLQPDELARFKALILRRAEREPVAYLLGEKEFYGRRFAVDRRCFIPRPETELLVQALLQHLGPQRPAGPEADPRRALDLCCGSGAVGVSLAAERPGLQVDLVELSPEAAEVARANAAALAPGRARVHEGDLFAPLPAGRRYAVIAANPPYVPAGEAPRLQPEVVGHEPHLALFGGADGLEVVRRILAVAPGWLEPGGLLALELDPPEGAEAVALALAAGFASARLEADLAGLDRMLLVTG